MTRISSPVFAQSLEGRTLRWKFDDGPAAGKTFEHTFRPDGTVVWREVTPGATDEGKGKGRGTKYASFEVAPETHLVSYPSDSGYTLTVAANLDTKECWGVASNEREWYPLKGSLEPVP
jgi:hypothetical protein